MNRRTLVTSIAATLMLPGAAHADGIGPAFDGLRAKSRLGGIHGVVALRRGDILFERYLSGPDQWIAPIRILRDVFLANMAP